MPPTTTLQDSDRDAHASPPAQLKKIYKSYQLMKNDGLAADANIVDFSTLNWGQDNNGLWRPSYIPAHHVQSICDAFDDFDRSVEEWEGPYPNPHANYFAYESVSLPGLHVFPSLLHPRTQLCLLSRLLHRDLGNPSHKSNVHLHYHVLPPEECSIPPGSIKHMLDEDYNNDDDDDDAVGGADPAAHSYFTHSPTSTASFLPKDPRLHKSLKISQFLAKKLRWLTLGGQYDWTKKTYPAETPPVFPRDIKELLQGLFPEMKAEAAIMNLYSPGDTLSLHRDVSEESENGLVSVSLGCDGILIVGLDEDVSHQGEEDSHLTVNEKENMNTNCIALRLHSGDVLYMSDKARFAWHGVPKIMAGTCPDWMSDWPARGHSGEESADRFDSWRGWMAAKRINLNVRQMFL
ncbi:MAG: Nucleic acid dioxygenase alkbh1 [Peltula sp. TS41687]|nr:MAG: Nucleic acid dioxygenase alkbh1 [Peltula sp. TS41687]